jgi:hypothetical protein
LATDVSVPYPRVANRFEAFNASDGIPCSPLLNPKNSLDTAECSFNETGSISDGLNHLAQWAKDRTEKGNAHCRLNLGESEETSQETTWFEDSHDCWLAPLFYLEGVKGMKKEVVFPNNDASSTGLAGCFMSLTDIRRKEEPRWVSIKLHTHEDV